jgi:hypothetical protein
VEKTGAQSALEQYDAYAARVRAQERKAREETKRRESNARASARIANGGFMDNNTTGRAIEGSPMNSAERFVPNDLSVLEQRRTLERQSVHASAQEKKEDIDDTVKEQVEREESEEEYELGSPSDTADVSFEFTPPVEAPATPRALTYPDTPIPENSNPHAARRSETEQPTTKEAVMPTRLRALDRWATKARVKLETSVQEASVQEASVQEASVQEVIKPTETAPTPMPSYVETVEEVTTACCGLVSKRRIRRVTPIT